MRIRFITLILLWLLGGKSFCQVTASDCNTAVNICQDANFAVDPNGFGNVDELLMGSISNPAVNPASANSGCLLAGELNSTWMIVNVAGSGTLEFSFGQDQSIGCFDWIMWPYDNNSCNAILNDLLPPVRCNWNGACEGYTGIGTPLPNGGDPSNFEPELNVLAGEQYLICLSNYSAQTTNVPLTFFGTALISCGGFLPVSINDTTICPGESATLTATAVGATSYLWSPGGQTTPSILVNPLVTANYTCTVNGLDVNGNPVTGSATATVTVLAQNDSLCGCFIQASNNGPVCVGDSFQLSATALIGGNYTWTNQGNTLSTNQQVNLMETAPGLYLFSLQGVDSTGEVCNSSTQVEVYPLPSANAGNDTILCEGAPLSLTATGGSTYQWNPPTVINGQPFVPPSTGSYVVTVTDSNGCVAIDTLLVTVVPVPTAMITPQPAFGFPGTVITLLNQSQNGQTYSWDFGNGSTLLLNSAANQSVSYLNEGIYQVSLLVSNQVCFDTISVWITITAPVVTIDIPNVFTPNADGTNAVWGIGTQNMVSLRVEVFNRWGNPMVELGLNENWDGTTKGKTAEEGVYFYVFEGKDVYGETHEGHGFFTLAR